MSVYVCVCDDDDESEMLTYMPFISELSASLVEYIPRGDSTDIITLREVDVRYKCS